MTLQVKNEREREMERTQRQINKIKNLSERVVKNVRNLQKLTYDYNLEFKLKEFTKHKSDKIKTPNK